MHTYIHRFIHTYTHTHTHTHPPTPTHPHPLTQRESDDMHGYRYRADPIRELLYFPKISFGTLALRNLVTAFDMPSMSVGFKNKKIYPQGPSALCAAPAKCAGAEVPYPPLNTCLDPPCHAM